MTGGAIMVASDIRAKDGNARDILHKIRINHGFIEPTGFVGGVYLI